MRTLVDWLLHLLWQARQPPWRRDDSGLSAILQLPGSGAASAGPGDRADLILDAANVEHAEAMIWHLVSLGTASSLRMVGLAEIDGPARRRLSRVARQVRKHGLLVALGSEPADATRARPAPSVAVPRLGPESSAQPSVTDAARRAPPAPHPRGGAGANLQPGCAHRAGSRGPPTPDPPRSDLAPEAHAEPGPRCRGRAARREPADR